MLGFSVGASKAEKVTQKKQATLKVAGRDVRLSNLDKFMYPKVDFTKGQVIDYYTRVARYILPHLKNRPITMKRFPNGIDGEYFYEKDAPSFTPDWIQTYRIPRTSEKSTINYILINDLPTLVWSANMANLEVHPFLAKVPNVDVPTVVVFDLDPGDEANILKSCEVASSKGGFGQVEAQVPGQGLRLQGNPFDLFFY